MAKKQSYKVIALAQGKNESDIEVMVKAENVEGAIAEATKKNPAIAKQKDVRVYMLSRQWMRVSA